MVAIKTDPFWYKDAIIYEMHVKAFKDSNGDGSGDFRGLIEKLDYVESLGVNTIWLLPFYPSPFRDDGYDISDYHTIHPRYGKLRDFRLFVREAHRRRIRVITELVINHTSDQHHWFQAARRARPGSARRNYYVWSDSNTTFAETRIIFTDTENSNWAWDPEAKAYYWHRFFTHQPDLNHNNPAVVKAVLKVMRFWFDMGVDGMRLDAVPYLCVREGTNNENLPETHAVLKEFRKYLDERYRDKMFLAEANQWPEDVRHYFADGDECHMAFHFPLMPRMFMAIRQEDRHPITEILERTPAIPENCQWALFLRNHDELTLEMVTDTERDYMYREYAKDSRMKLNVGIRRRLAPLLDNSRRRLELMNSLLFSMPGSPIIYYGDELGMGDNIFLGDRDGVRTPMQWNMDRNAGFSTADVARLYLPVIMDPVYGYQAVNVEAQERDPSSMLHFMRRMIALRRQHTTFGRGSIEFLKPPNRKILAYIRRYKGEILLIVANLSRFVQPAELDLSEFNGRIPVEMIGRTDFPAIGELPYFITLGPHSFYWFQLESPAEPIVAGAPASGSLAGIPHLSLDEMWVTLLEPEYLYSLANDIVSPFLAGQRWFRGKAKDLTACRAADWCKLGASFYFFLIDVQYSQNGEETYVMPLKIFQGVGAQALAAELPDSVMAFVKNWRGEGILYDALMDKASCEVLFTALRDGRRYPTAGGGTLEMAPTVAFEELTGLDSPCTSVRKLGAEQSNTSIILGDTFILKLYRQLEQGINPDVEMSLFLTEQAQFKGVARVAGTIQYRNASGHGSTVAMIQEFIAGAKDGWSVAQAASADYYRHAKSLSANGAQPPIAGLPLIDACRTDPPAMLMEMSGEFLRQVRALGRRTAEFHLALAGATNNQDFKPAKASRAYVEQLAASISHEIGEALSLLNAKMGELPPHLHTRADLVLAEGPSLLGEIERLPETTGDFGTLIRIHGDYHLGQVLETGSGEFILLDFEGEPIRPLAERRRKGSPLKDLAGMIRSLHYAAHTPYFSEASDQDNEERLAPWREAWQQWTSAVFLGAYLDTATGAPFLPAANLDLLLQCFLLEKIFYELRYELGNRPDWVAIPLAGIVDIL